MTEEIHKQHGKTHVIGEDFAIDILKRKKKNQQQAIEGIRLCKLSMEGLKNANKAITFSAHFLKTSTILNNLRRACQNYLSASFHLEMY